MEVVYCHPMMNGYRAYAERFLASYLSFPPLVDHASTVVCNGGRPDAETEALFSPFPNLRLVEGNNIGYDIGAYITAAKESTADLIAFFGASTYFKREGWLLRMASAFQELGEAQYGAMGNRGDSNMNVKPHLRTTGIWMSPQLLNSYPHSVVCNEDRYSFEHGEKCFTEWVSLRGLKNWVVTWDGAYQWAEWDSFPNGFHRGDQSALLCGDRISEPPYHPVP